MSSLLECYLNAGQGLMSRNDYGWTPLHWAVQKENIQVVRLLLEHGADVNARDKSGKTPSQLGSSGNKRL